MVSTELLHVANDAEAKLQMQLLDRNIDLANAREVLNLDNQLAFIGARGVEPLIHRAPDLIARVLSVRTVVVVAGADAASNDPLFDNNGRLDAYRPLFERVIVDERRIAEENRVGLPLILPPEYKIGAPLGVMILEWDKKRDFDPSKSPILTNIASMLAKHIPSAHALYWLSRTTDARFLATILTSPELIRDGWDVDASIIFGDIVGSSKLAVSMRSKEFFDMLNAYYSCVDRIVHQNGLVLDKFVGDAFMAHGNTLVKQNNHVETAVRSALLMQEALQQLTDERTTAGLPTCHFRMGVHSGRVKLGVVGSPNRGDLTLVGDPVNTARRVEEAGEAGSVFVSSEIVRQCHDNSLDFDPVRAIILKGTESRIGLFRVTRASG